MIVSRTDFLDVVKKLSTPGMYSLDCETTGLRVWQSDRLFSIIIADESKAYYFNFQDYPGLDSRWILPREWCKEFNRATGQVSSTWFMHNAKFDMAAIWHEGIEVQGTVHCTEAIARVERNDRRSYKLDRLAREVGDYKDDAVKAYCQKNKLYRIETDEDGVEEKIPMYYKVPFEIIVPYGEQDAIVTRKLGLHQIAVTKDFAGRQPANRPNIIDVAKQERELTKVCFKMEKVGIRVDKDFSREALEFERKRMRQQEIDFQAATGLPFKDHYSTLQKAFDAVGEKYPLTDRGNPSFRKEVLEDYETPIAKLVLDYRNAQKRANTYFSNFIYYADDQNRIHANIRQGGTVTGRMSYSDPNFQNLPKRKEKVTDKYNTRRAILPTEGNALVMFDYDQMEYKMMLEYAQEMDVIEQVLKGLDIHQATANMMGVERDPAKTLNFMLLYGGGVAKLCAALFKPTLQVPVLKELVTLHLWNRKPKQPHLLIGLRPDDVAYNLEELHKAHALLEKYFEKLPKVKKFSDGVIQTARERGWIQTWSGRVQFLNDYNFAYAKPNHLIQGGCACVVKKAMIKIDRLLEGKRSKMIIQVHDELDFDMHPNEFGLIPEIQHIMETAYPHKFLPLTVGVDHSFKSWADKVEGAPI